MRSSSLDSTPIVRILPCLALIALPVCGERLPTPSPHQMCAEADAIVLGDRVGASRIAVREWILPPRREGRGGSFIDIVGLEKHGRVIAAPGPTGEQVQGNRLKSQRLLCFLEEKGDGWRPLAAEGRGSSGLIWLEEGKCYRYERLQNPGSCLLRPSRAHETEKDLRTAVSIGLADRGAWERVQKIAHPEEKAIVLCSYLLERTSPEGQHRTYRSRVRRLLPKLGEQAVAELMVLLQNAVPGDSLDDAVLILNDLGPAARVAVPHLVGLLKHPGSAHPARVIEALGRIGDATVAQRLLPYLEHELRVRAEVAGAMARFAYQDSGPQIVKALPEAGTVKKEDAHHVYAMLQALYELGSEETPRLTRNYLEVPAMRHFQNLLEPFLAEQIPE